MNPRLSGFHIGDAHLAVTAAMAGIAWFVQVVHYPLFARAIPSYYEAHARLTGYVVAPLMLSELALAIALAILRPSIVTMTGLGLLAVIWLSTFWLQVPLHERLRRQFTEGAHRRLVRTNWIRTAGWTARAIFAYMLTS